MVFQRPEGISDTAMAINGARTMAVNGTRVSINGTKSRTNSDSRESNSCKVVMLGKSGVGKTALTVRYITKRFIGEYSPTLESVYKYQTNVDSDEIRLDILDTAGQMPDSWKDYYALWGDCFVFVYSITDRESFDEIINIKKHVEAIRRSSAVCGILVGNKSDLLHDRQVPENEAGELADEIGCKFYELSAADWTHVNQIVEMFQDLARENRRMKLAREGRGRKSSSSTRFRQAIQKVISGKNSTKKSTATQ